VESLQAAGRVRALVTLMAMPSWALFLKESQRQLGAVARTVFKEEQHFPWGLVWPPSSETKGRQSAKVRTRAEQSAEGAGAWAWPWCDDEMVGATSAEQMKATTHAMRNHLGAMSKVLSGFNSHCFTSLSVRECELELGSDPLFSTCHHVHQCLMSEFIITSMYFTLFILFLGLIQIKPTLNLNQFISYDHFFFFYF